MSEQTQAPEAEARTLGWVPKEEFRGDESRWVDAETFLERGHTVMPILKASNKRLEGEVERLRGETERLQGLFQASQEAITELQTVHTEHTKAAVARARKDLLSELKAAREDGNVELEVKLTDELADLRDQEKAADAKPKPAATPAQPVDAVHPDFKAWVSDNPWFGSDQRKTMRAMGIAQELRSDPENDGLLGRVFYDKVLAVMEERAGGPTHSKVGGTRPSAGAATGSKDYANLPPDAKDACDRQGKKLVGEGRAFKDVTAWRKYYTDMYYEGEGQ